MPMPGPDLAYLPAAEALARFRDRSLSPVELTQAILARAEETEPRINALPLRYPEAALDAARRAEARYMGRGEAPRPLEGLCLAIKDSTELAGQPTSAGSLVMPGTPAVRTAIANARALAAGAIPHARSATPEFSCASFTWSRKWGVTRNPWAPTRTPGGSSGGAGAALAAGSATLALGSDIAGSIRIPAACSGIVGLKPSRGRVPQDPPFNLDPYCHVGPMARNVQDAALLLAAIAGPDPRDPVSLPGGATPPPEPSDLKGLRIAWSEDLGRLAVDPEVRADFRAALAVFADLGAVLQEAPLDWGPETVAAALLHLRGVFAASMLSIAETRGGDMTPYARAFALSARDLPPDAAWTAMQCAGQMGAAFGAVMEGADLFLCPTLATAPVAADHDPGRDRIEIEGQIVDPLLGWVLTVPFNMLSTHPVLAVPTGLARCGAPLGIQIVGRPFADMDVLAAGLAFETAQGPWFAETGPRPTMVDDSQILDTNVQT